MLQRIINLIVMMNLVLNIQALTPRLMNAKVRVLDLCNNYWHFFLLNWVLNDQISRCKLIVSIPHPEENQYEKKEKKEKEKGYIWVLREEYEPSKRLDKSVFSGKGLKNLGNTWFFNSVMQWLTASRDLYYVYKDDNIRQSGRGYPLNDCMREFLGDMRDSDRSIISPVDLFKSIIRKNNRFRGYQVNNIGFI